MERLANLPGKLELFSWILRTFRRLNDLDLGIGYIHVDADAQLITVLRADRLRSVHPVLIVIVEERIRIPELNTTRSFEVIHGVVRDETLDAQSLVALLERCVHGAVLRQGRVGYPGEEERGSSGVVILIDEDFAGDGEVARMVQNVVVLPHHGRRVDADVVLAEEHLVVLVEDLLGGLIFGTKDVGRSTADYVTQRHFSLKPETGLFQHDPKRP